MKPSKFIAMVLVCALALGSVLTETASAGNAYETAVLADSPVVYYRFDEGAGPTATNIGSNGTGWNGTVSGNVTFGATAAQSLLGTALDLSGGNDGEITTGGNISNYLNGTASMDFWVKTTQYGSGGYNAPALTGEDGGSDDIWWGWNNGGQMGVMIGDQNAQAITATAINDGAWHYLLMTRDSTTGVINVYLDGNTTPSGTATLIRALPQVYNWLGRGSTNSQPGSDIDAVIDEVAIYNSVLTGAQGNAHYLAAFDLSGNGLTADYFNNTTFTEPAYATQIDSTVDFDWGAGGPAALGGTVDNFTIRWSGQVMPVYSEIYTFESNNDDGISAAARGASGSGRQSPRALGEECRGLTRRQRGVSC